MDRVACTNIIERNGQFRHGSEFYHHQIRLIREFDSFFKLGLSVPEIYQGTNYLEALEQNGVKMVCDVNIIHKFCELLKDHNLDEEKHQKLQMLILEHIQHLPFHID